MAEIDFGIEARRHRIDKGWSQMDVAAKLGMSDANYGNIERGKQSPTLEQMEAIAAALETTVGELIGVTKTVNTAHQPINTIVGQGRDVITHNFNEEQARQAERLFALMQEQNQTLAKLVEVLAKP